MRNVPDYVAEILRSDPPPHCGVIPETLPVVSFGDPQRATVATLGINPSSAEFIEEGRFLEHDRRLPTLRSLGATTPAELDDHQVATAVDEFGRYFEIRRYKTWFDPFDAVLGDSLGVSYMDGTACHLDLVPWATDPKWRDLTKGQRDKLLETSRTFLHQQLQESNVALVVVNGRQVWDVLTERRLVDVTHEETLALPGVNKSTTVRIGVGLRGLTFAGWTLNIQGSHGVSKADKATLARWLSGLRATIPPRLSGDHLEPVTLASKAELARLLRHWFRTTTGDTVGHRGSFGRTKLIDVALGGGRTAGLNADTTRAAVAQYLDDVEQRGPDAAWRVIANKNGAYNKVEFTTAGQATPGWYCYLTPEAEGDDLV